MQNNEFQNRRDFLKLGAKVASSVALAGLGANMLLADSIKSQTKGENMNTTQLPFRILGKDSAALRVSALGLGCMGMSANHGVPPEEKAMIKLLHEAYELARSLGYIIPLINSSKIQAKSLFLGQLMRV